MHFLCVLPLILKTYFHKIEHIYKNAQVLSENLCILSKGGPPRQRRTPIFFSYAAGAVSDVCGVSGIAGVCVGSTSGTPGSVIAAPGSLPGTVGSIAGTFRSTVGSAALPTRMMRLRLL